MAKTGATILAAALLAAAVLFGSGEAHAQACGTVTGQPESVYEAFIGDLGLAFPIGDEAMCEKIAKAGVSACHKAVSDTVGCLNSLVGSILKGTKTACSTFKNESGCNDDAKDEAASDRAQLDLDSDAAHAECDGLFAAAITDVCLEGFPM